jgi:hypothetical protein
MGKLHLLAGAVLLVFALASPRVWAADEVASNHRPVKEVASLRISVGTPRIGPAITPPTAPGVRQCQSSPALPR